MHARHEETEEVGRGLIVKAVIVTAVLAGLAVAGAVSIALTVWQAVVG